MAGLDATLATTPNTMKPQTTRDSYMQIDLKNIGKRGSSNIIKQCD